MKYLSASSVTSSPQIGVGDLAHESRLPEEGFATSSNLIAYAIMLTGHAMSTDAMSNEVFNCSHG